MTALRRVLPFVVVLALGAAAGLLVVGLAVSVEGDLGPGSVQLRAGFGDGRTSVALPPLGRVSAPTHGTPVALQAQVNRVDLEALQQLFGDPAPQIRLRREVEDDLVPLLQRYALVAAGVAAASGAVAAALLPGRRWTFLPAGALGGALGVAAVLGGTWLSFSPAAFQAQPRFEGTLARAPEVLAAVQRFGNLNDLVRDRVATLSQRVAQLYAAAAGEVDGTTAEVRILHVSDIHSNPIGLEVARSLAVDFDVEAVIDTGDITSFGLPVEARLGELLSGFPVPYYLVPGNHDSDANRAAMAAVPDVHVLDGEVVEVAGIEILGVADPTFTADNEIDTATANLAKLASAPEVAQLVRQVQPDLLAVHDVRQAERATGLVPVVIAGHTHARALDVVEGSLMLTVGSTGATGLGSFTVETDLPYEAEVLRFRGDALVAVDYVTFAGIDGGFQVERQLVAELSPVEASAPFAGVSGEGTRRPTRGGS